MEGSGDSSFEVSGDLIIADLKSLGNIRALTYKCEKEEEEKRLPSSNPGKSPKTVLNAFNVLMDGKKVHFKEKSTWYLFT